ncbi:MAG: DNA recombination protein RmuC [Christensenellaceae bacterium]|nr:DNA recombination protein RmuC [Christensenellaceae bacterium]
MEILLFIICIISVALSIATFIAVLSVKRTQNSRDIEMLRKDNAEQQQALRSELNSNVQTSVKLMGDMIAQNQAASDRTHTAQLQDMNRTLSDKQDAQTRAMLGLMSQFENRFKTFETSNEQKLENMRSTIEKRLSYIQQDNNEKLEAMRVTVDEKLQKTLEDKMTQSFRLVNERLEQVYKGLGEMQNLAVGVGDLKKVLSNVKTRGILGEIQLDAILKEILTQEQYDTNVATIPGSTERVEFAVKLPSDDDGFIYLPIDSKFPGDSYAQLQDAYESGSQEAVNQAYATLSGRIKQFAKDIRTKYVMPPHTTEFAIMFLPFEGLYAEVVNRGLVEILQREYRINIAGPSTMAALLNSLQMGFKTLAIQKRSSEVWQILGAVRSEFDKFGEVLAATQQRINQANSELDKLIGVRTRAIQRKLRDVEKLSDTKATELIPDSE